MEKRSGKGSRRSERLRGITFLHEDDDVIVVEKACGVLTQPTLTGRAGDAQPCVLNALTDYVRKGQLRSSKRVWLVHRLDRGTSGVLLVAKTEAARDWLREHWGEVTEKTYLARVTGSLEACEGVFESYLREDENQFVRSVKNIAYGKYARTEWRVYPEGDVRTGTTCVAVALKTGRKNQIRVHFAEAGHPVVGDRKYGDRRVAVREARLCLHAWRLAFIHPTTGKRLFFETPVPDFIHATSRYRP